MLNIVIKPEFFSRHDDRVRRVIDAFRRHIENIPSIRVSRISYGYHSYGGRWQWSFYLNSDSETDGEFSVDIQYYPVVLNQLIGVASPLLVFPDDAGYIPEGRISLSSG